MEYLANIGITWSLYWTLGWSLFMFFGVLHSIMNKDMPANYMQACYAMVFFALPAILVDFIVL